MDRVLSAPKSIPFSDFAARFASGTTTVIMRSLNPVKRSTRLAGKRQPPDVVALGGGGGGGGYATNCGESLGLRNERG